MRRFAAVHLVLLLTPILMLAQKGGESTYSFLGLTNAAKVAALGGELVSLMDDDINLIFHNPSLLTSQMHNHLNMNYVNYFAGVNYGYAPGYVPWVAVNGHQHGPRCRHATGYRYGKAYRKGYHHGRNHSRRAGHRHGHHH